MKMRQTDMLKHRTTRNGRWPRSVPTIKAIAAMTHANMAAAVVAMKAVVAIKATVVTMVDAADAVAVLHGGSLGFPRTRSWRFAPQLKEHTVPPFIHSTLQQPWRRHSRRNSW